MRRYAKKVAWGINPSKIAIKVIRAKGQIVHMYILKMVIPPDLFKSANVAKSLPPEEATGVSVPVWKGTNAFFFMEAISEIKGVENSSESFERTTNDSIRMDTTNSTKSTAKPVVLGAWKYAWC